MLLMAFSLSGWAMAWISLPPPSSAPTKMTEPPKTWAQVKASLMAARAPRSSSAAIMSEAA